MSSGSTRRTAGEVWNAVRTSGHSRYPVCRGQLDELVGVVLTGDLAEWLGNPESGELAARVHARSSCMSRRGSCGCSTSSANRRCTSP
jgi:CBS domain containing-hemolysin-like protein